MTGTKKNHDDDGALFDQALNDIRLALDLADDEDVIAVAVGGLHRAVIEGMRVQTNSEYAGEMCRMAIWAASVAFGSRAKVVVGKDGEPTFVATGEPVPAAPALFFAAAGLLKEAKDSGPLN